MNPYIARGIIEDLKAGKRIGIIGNTRPAARNAFLVTTEAIDNPEAIGVKSWRSGARDERLEMNNGGRLEVHTRNSIRGATLDVLVLIQWEDIVGDDLSGLDELLATKAELIQS